MKSKINYGKLVKSSRDLVTNTNFRNNQNYIISDFSKFKFVNSYYRTWFSKNLWSLIGYIINFMIGFGILLAIFKEDLNGTYFLESFKYFFISALFIISLLSIFIIFDRFIYYFYKKFSFIKRKHIFNTDRYIFLKNPKKNKYKLNRRDFISFKK